MAAGITRFVPKEEKLRRGQADQLRQGLRDLWQQLELPFPLMRDLMSEIDRRTQTKSRWRFIMINASIHDEIINYLLDNSRFPRLSIRLWAKCLKNADDDTGEVLRSREQLAEDLGTIPDNISRIMTELMRFDAVICKREKVPGLHGAGTVRYFLNPRIASHMAGDERNAAQAAAPQPGARLHLVPKAPLRRKTRRKTLRATPGGRSD